jgi:hypothetical protein
LSPGGDQYRANLVPVDDKIEAALLPRHRQQEPLSGADADQSLNRLAVKKITLRNVHNTWTWPQLAMRAGLGSTVTKTRDEASWVSAPSADYLGGSCFFPIQKRY